MRRSRHRWIYTAMLPALAVVWLAPLRYAVTLAVLVGASQVGDGEGTGGSAG